MITFTKICSAIQKQVKKSNPMIGTIKFVPISSMTVLNNSPIVDNVTIRKNINDLIASADEEVLIQYYKFEPESDNGANIIDALEKLSVKAHSEQKKIKVKFIINHRTGLAAAFTKGTKILSRI